MSTLSRFDPDIFISYSSVDNSDGWVNEFHQQLETKLAEFLGRKPIVWRDAERLTIEEQFQGAILSSLTNAGVLVVIVTPSYAASKLCQRELSDFQRAADKKGGLLIGGRVRSV